MSNTPSLLPCPFCGGVNIIHCGHHMYCHACGADGPDADSQNESEAIAAWNCRTPQPAPIRPFTKAQQERLYRNRPANVGKGTSLADWRRTVEFIEAAHGITGGRHGAE